MSLLFQGVPYSQVPAVHLVCQRTRQVLPGYFSTPEAPGDLFACSGFAHCPGGSPGTCAQGALCGLLGGLVWKAPKMSRNPRFFLEIETGGVPASSTRENRPNFGPKRKLY